MKLTSRYGDTWELEPIEGGYVWKNLPEHLRVGYFPDSKDDIYFIDPPGGPFLEIGKDIVPGEFITRFIWEDQKVTIKTYKKEG